MTECGSSDPIDFVKRSVSNGCIDFVDVPHTRYVCVDFETNGFPEKNAMLLPWSSYPTQVSLTAVENGEVIHLYDSYIQGAESLSNWAMKNTKVTWKKLNKAPVLREVIEQMAALLQPTDWLVAHNAHFDFQQCLIRTCERERIYNEDLHKILSLPRFCTMQCSYMKSVPPKRHSMKTLCNHFNVEWDGVSAHDATYDSGKLAHCVAEAYRRGVMLDVPYTIKPNWEPKTSLTRMEIHEILKRPLK